jgi:hypothetical protein
MQSTPTKRRTIRDGHGEVIVDCIINEDSVTNAQYKEYLKKLGYPESAVRRVRRVRGPLVDVPPWSAKSPREIVGILLHAGLNPASFWVEYSASDFDRRCMAVLIRAAGMSVESILPKDENSWPVCKDFACALPSERQIVY